MAAISGLTSTLGQGVQQGISPAAEAATRMREQMGVAEAESSQQGSFFDMVQGLVNAVQDKQEVSKEMVGEVLAGKTDNLHQTVVAMQESGVAFTLLMEMRNKLMDAYREIMRIQQ